MSDQGKCKHELCRCTAEGESGYCSDHCRDAVDQDLVEINATAVIRDAKVVISSLGKCRHR